MPNYTPQSASDVTLINEYTSLQQWEPTTTELSNGNILQVWTSISQPGDNNDRAVVGRILVRQEDNSFVAGDEFLINQTTYNAQRYPTVAALEDGAFIVGWESLETNDITQPFSIFARIFTSSGPDATAAGDEIVISSGVDLKTDQFYPQVNVSYDENGETDFVFFTYSHGDGGSFNSDRDIYGQQFSIGDDFSLEATSDRILINSTTEGTQDDSALDTFSDGNAVVVWNGDLDSGWDGPFFQIIAPGGQFVGEETQTGDSSVSPEVAVLNDDTFILVSEGGNSTSRFIDVRRYDSEGTELATTTINLVGGGVFSNPRVAALPDGGFFVSWIVITSDGIASGDDIRGQRFDAGGSPIGDEISLISRDIEFAQDIIMDMQTLSDGSLWVTYQLLESEAENRDFNVYGELFEMTSYPEGGAGNDTIYGTDDPSLLLGNDGADLLFGGNDSDQIHGGDGTDSVYGGTGSDTLTGGAGNDMLSGGGANDRLHGDSGNDLITGDGGNDILYGDIGNDTLDGGAGNDTANYFDSAGAVILDLSTGGSRGQAKGDTYVDVEHVTGSKRSDDITGDDGDNRLKGKGGWDTLYGADGDDTIEGGSGNDILYGGAGNDVIDGDNRSDWIEGGAGSDRLDGGNGFDTLNGGAGNDTLIGGQHADHFVFDSGSGDDTVADFELSKDVLDLSGTETDFTDIASVAAVASETETGLLIDLGGGDSLLLSNLTLSGLADMDIIF